MHVTASLPAVVSTKSPEGVTGWPYLLLRLTLQECPSAAQADGRKEARADNCIALALVRSGHLLTCPDPPAWPSTHTGIVRRSAAEPRPRAPSLPKQVRCRSRSNFSALRVSEAHRVHLRQLGKSPGTEQRNNKTINKPIRTSPAAPCLGPTQKPRSRCPEQILQARDRLLQAPPKRMFRRRCRAGPALPLKFGSLMLDSVVPQPSAIETTISQLFKGSCDFAASSCNRCACSLPNLVGRGGRHRSG